ncbi:C40 family peptidase [Fictibacillus enclensis]|uniref:C40 family peptidase n=1 Tax=Fictibacillus enclensis TaxID=1017270 RepID=UPI0025A1A211|nr:C40 family peptidase [Fictibacillus enclensis]MDM5201364.1 C40 family peptidase [Fictibacillus enclensis]
MKKWMAAAVVAASLVTGMTVGGMQPAENVYAAAKDDIPFNVNPVQIFFKFAIPNAKEAQRQFAKEAKMDVVVFKKNVKEFQLQRLTEVGHEKGQFEFSATFFAKLNKSYKGTLSEGYNHLYFMVKKTGNMEYTITSWSKEKQIKNDMVDNYFGDQAAAVAVKNIGKPFKMGGTTPKGFDASGFVLYSYQTAAQLTLPRTVADQYKAGTSVKAAKLHKGDLVFYDLVGKKKATFVGIYNGNQTFIAATTKGVRAVKMTDSYWKTKYIGARRVLE